VAGNRLEPINLTDFTGGLNLRRDQFQLGENESPDMLNVDVDPRGGFYTRKGWQRWNDVDVPGVAAGAWQPRNGAVHNLADLSQITYVASGTKLYAADTSATFTEVAGVTCGATPHLADFATWGQDIYIVTGAFGPSWRRHADGSLLQMAPATWSEVDAPTQNTMPMAEFIETHAGYTFVANISEGAALFPARVRWSHPNRPDAFRELDYLDIDAGGGKITAITSYADHLLIFKTNSLWALFGYDDDSWQLVKVSNNVGCPAITSVTRSETAVYFFSASNKGGIYGYSGGEPVYMSEKVAPALEVISAYDLVFVSWAGRRLWVGVPWSKKAGPTPEPDSLLVFDPDIGQGSWTMYRSEHGAVTVVLDGSDVNAKFPLAAFWCHTHAVMAVLDTIDDAYDTLKVANTPEPFVSYYRTRWMNAGWPDRLKSWRRPMFICRKVPRPVDLLVEQFRDYDETTVRRTGHVEIAAESGPQWKELGFDDPSGTGFDWTELGEKDPAGRGVNWGETRAGASLLRGGPMGHARALQVRVVAAPNTPLQKWGVDGIVVKIVTRRFRT
jgi:hypothetical protein